MFWYAATVATVATVATAALVYLSRWSVIGTEALPRNAVLLAYPHTSIMYTGHLVVQHAVARIDTDDIGHFVDVVGEAPVRVDPGYGT